MNIFKDKKLLRKCFGVLFLFIEMNLLGGTIFGFPAIFQILSKENIYQTNEPIKQYQVKKTKIFI
jgi:hypothetical protein